MATLLIVEVEIPINELIKRNLQEVRHRCISVIDIILQEIDGYEVVTPNRLSGGSHFFHESERLSAATPSIQ